MGLSGNSEQCRNLCASHAEITKGFKFKASELSEAIIFLDSHRRVCSTSRPLADSCHRCCLAAAE